MNRAQKRIKELLAVAKGEVEREYLNECYKAWEGYDDRNYSYPAWQLRAIEKKYGMTTADIKELYNVKFVTV